MTTTQFQETEVRAIIEFQDSNGNKEIREKRFAKCDDAWLWQRQQSKMEKSRRADKDKKYTLWAAYVGCTITGKTFGGILMGKDKVYGELSLEEMKYRESQRLHSVR